MNTATKDPAAPRPNIEEIERMLAAEDPTVEDRERSLIAYIRHLESTERKSTMTAVAYDCGFRAGVEECAGKCRELRDSFFELAESTKRRGLIFHGDDIEANGEGAAASGREQEGAQSIRVGVRVQACRHARAESG